jgi:hypothetical protein
MEFEAIDEDGSVPGSAENVVEEVNISSDDVAETEQVLQNHMVEVQKALMNSFDRQMQTLEKIIWDKDERLTKTLSEKKDIAVALYKTKADFQVLQSALSSL